MGNVVKQVDTIFKNKRQLIRAVPSLNSTVSGTATMQWNYVLNFTDREAVLRL